LERVVFQPTKVLLLLAVIAMVRPTAIPCAAGADCFVGCMERSGCWSGGMGSPNCGFNNSHAMEMCQIQCRGRSGDGWGAIAYSKKDKKYGYSFEQASKAVAEKSALQYCNKSGGAQCVIETSFDRLCGAVAADGDQVAWGTSGTRAAAEQRAVGECTKLGGKKCEVKAWVCSAPNTNSGSPSAPAAPRQPKAIAWGAIAYSSGDMGAGWSQGKDDRASAEKEAMAACAQRGKACVLRSAFNKQCGALAADRDFTGVGTSTDQRAALQKALDECKKAGGTRCAPHIAFCSM
jgi:hypothetical protein